MRRRTRVWLGAAAAAGAFAMAALSPASSQNLLLNGDFEGGTNGWAPPIGGTLAVDASTMPAEGAAAAHLTSTRVGLLSIATQYWLLDVDPAPGSPAHLYTLTALARDNETDISGVTVRLTFMTQDGGIVPGAEAIGALGGSDSPGYRAIAAGPILRPAGAKYARVTVSAQATSIGASFSVDSVSITATLPPPPPTPTATEEPVPALPPESESEPPATAPIQSPPAATATPRATVTRTPTQTRTPTPTPTPTPPPLPASWLRNTDFSLGASGWSVTRGRLSIGSHIEGHGQSLVLTSDDAATAWVQQTVSVTPAGWYAASALLAPLNGVEAAWVRIAWYASADGSGAQLSTDDSPAVASESPNAYTQGEFEVIATGPVRAPSNAHSARVRILLRAATERGASVAIDNVTFDAAEPSEASPHAPQVPAARTGPSAPAPSTPSPRIDLQPSASNASTPTPAAPTRAETGTRGTIPGATAEQQRLRITEIMSNPEEGGADGEYEWVEVMNTGTAPASLAGLTIRDRRSGSVLPPYLLDPGAVVVIAAPGARIPDGTALVRLRHAIGNGLGNDGDRVALVAPDGREIDAVSYGEGVEEGEQPLPAPGPGQSIERSFSSSGILLDARVSPRPTPGMPPEARAAAGGPPGAATRAPIDLASTLTPAWAILVALAGGLLLGAGAARAAAIVRGRDLEA